MRVIVVGFLLAMMCGCGGGGVPPVLSNVAVSTSPVVRGQPASGQAHVADPDGLGGLKMRLRIAGASASATSEVAVQGASDSVKEADVPFLFVVSTAAPAGGYTVGVTAIDGSGNTSREVTISVNVQ